MLHTTAGQLAVNEALPEDLRNHDRVLDKKGIEKLLQEVATKHPDKYRQVAHELSRVGYHTAYITGGNSFSLKHMRQSLAGKQAEYDIGAKVRKIYADQALSDDEKSARVVELLLDSNKDLETKTYKESLAEQNPFAMQVLSGARGNPMNLKSLRSADLLYVDHHDDPIPIPILSSYSKGLTPVEYFAGTFGARKGVLDTKMAVQDSGFMAKQFNQIGHRLVVVGDDDPVGVPRIPRGFPADVEDPDNEGALLAHDMGGYKRNTVLTPRIIGHMKELGIKKLLLRSPTVGGSATGGVYAKDLGIREKQTLSPIGDFVGIAAGQALSEPLTQGALGSKHSGGVAGAAKSVSGFKLVNQLIQVPKTFRGGAAHAQVDGRVDSVRPAPQGGTYIQIGGERHHVHQGFEVNVKPGDIVEAGDVLSEGIPNPSEIVRHKGVGEGRRYLVGALHKAYKDSGMGAHRRNIEVLVRGLVNNVVMTDEVGDNIPGDVVPYSRMESGYKPRTGAKIVPVNKSADMYLEEPALHYSIGTRMRPSVVRNLQEFGIPDVHVHQDPPPFEPEMIRGMESLAHDPDWMTRFLGSYLQKNTLKAVHRTESSDESGTSYVPALARGVDFARIGLTKGYKPKSIMSGLPG